jgi:hypothetical protein
MLHPFWDHCRFNHDALPKEMDFRTSTLKLVETTARFLAFAIDTKSYAASAVLSKASLTSKVQYPFF